MKLQGVLVFDKGEFLVGYSAEMFSERERVLGFIESNKKKGWISESIYRLDGSIYVKLSGRMSGGWTVIRGELKRVD